MKTVLFACTHNAGRSQMAASIFNSIVQPGAARAISAGTEPAVSVHPEVLMAMKELGIDLSGARPQLLTEDLAASAQFLITMGCGEKCPVVPGIEREDWELLDPKGRPLEQVRAIRDDIRKLVERLIATHGWGRATPGTG
ncbi:MAG TPA: arsenate reductase ArsC, partial [Vicinamibacteria bacterium]|nr:arsenate reductase ArsC [Vicinamibacteria bacterium]